MRGSFLLCGLAFLLSAVNASADCIARYRWTVPSQGLVHTARGDSLVPLPTDTLIARRITYRFYIPATVDTFEYPVIKGQARIDTVHTLLPIFLTIRLRTYRWCLIDGQRTRVFDRAYACPLSLSSK